MPIAIFAPVPPVHLPQFVFSPEPNGRGPLPIDPAEPSFSEQLSAIGGRTITADQHDEPMAEVPKIMLEPLSSVLHSSTDNLVSDCAPETDIPEQGAPETDDIIEMISTGYSERPVGIMSFSVLEVSPANRSSDVFFLTDSAPFSGDTRETVSAPLMDKPETIDVENTSDHSTWSNHPKAQPVSDQTSPQISSNIAFDSVEVNPATENLPLPIPLLSVTATAKSGADIPTLTRAPENAASVLIKPEGFVEINPMAENLNHLHITADSPTLGAVDINLSQAERELSIHFTANALTTEWLAVHSSVLRLAILDSWQHYATGANGIMSDAAPEDNRINLTFTCNDEQSSRQFSQRWMENGGDFNIFNQDTGYLTTLLPKISSKNDSATSRFLSPRSLYLDILI